MGDVIQGPWTEPAGPPVVDDVDPSQFENVDTNTFSRLAKGNKGTMDVDNIRHNNYEAMVAEKDLKDLRQAIVAIQSLNEQLLNALAIILTGLNSNKIQILTYRDVGHIEDTVKKLDAIYALVRKILPDNNVLMDFKRDHFYVCIYHMYERVMQEVTKEKKV